jgi:uncharacterized protein (TIGR02145 family)
LPSARLIEVKTSNTMKKLSILQLVSLAFFLGCDLDVVPDIGMNGTPFACFGTDKTECNVADCTVSFDATCSQNAVLYKWDFDNNGTTDAEGANEKQVSHTYDTPGLKTIKLTIENADGDIDEETKTVNVMSTNTSYQLSTLNWDANQEGIIEADYVIEVQLSSPNNPNAILSNVDIQFAVTNGNGTLGGNDATSALTDSEGKANVTWKLGNKLFETQSVSATVTTVGITASPVVFALTPDHFKDARDGNIYKTVEFNGDIWMEENLRYAAVGECYEGSLDNCTEYGRLYSWEEMMSTTSTSFYSLPHQGICPNGWRTPEKADFEMVEQMVQDNSIYMFMCCPELWNSGFVNDGFISNSTGLSFKPGGRKDAFGFYGIENEAIFWTASKDFANGTFYRYGMSIGDSLFDFLNAVNQHQEKYSCRCIKVN